MTNNDADELDYHLSVMSKKLVANLHPRDLHLFNADCEPITILYTTATDTVAGYPCKKAIAIFPGLDQPEIEIWYTNHIEVKDPNWFGPLSKSRRAAALRAGAVRHAHAPGRHNGDPWPCRCGQVRGEGELPERFARSPAQGTGRSSWHLHDVVDLSTTYR